MNNVIQMFDWQRERDMNSPLGKLLQEYCKAQKEYQAAKMAEQITQLQSEPPCKDCITPYAYRVYGTEACKLCQPILGDVS